MTDQPDTDSQPFRVEEATIEELHEAIRAGRTTCLDVVKQYIARVRAYNGVASLLGHVARLELSNVRLFAEDARRLLPALPDASIARAFLLFPDPWPKRRHEERRFVAPDNLDEIARLLVDGGEFRVASDDPTYQDWARRQMALRPDFAPIAPDAWDRRPDDWAPTRYEQKAVDAGRKCTYMRYRRAPRTTLPRP